MAKKKILISLILITLIGGFLRFYRLTNVPPAINWDEISHAYNALSLLHTGRDQWGQLLPLANFRAYGDYPAPINLYFTAGVFALAGASDWAARFPHALTGTLMIPMVFLAAYYWRKNKLLALLAAFFVALEPWTLFTSRQVLQSNWAVILISIGLALYLNKRLSLALLFWGLSMYAYHNTRIFIPLLVLPLLPAAIKSKTNLLILLILFIPIIFILLLPATRARNTWVGIIDSGAVARIEELRNITKLPSAVSRLVYNRPVYFITTALGNYVGYFSPKYLFVSGGTQYQYSLPGSGVLNLALLPFFYIGLLLLVIKKQKFLLYWLLLAPLPAAVTRDQFAVVRATTMLPVLELVSAWGVVFAFGYLKKSFRPVLLILFLLIFSFTLAGYLYRYFSLYPKEYSQSWQYGYKQLSDYISSHNRDYDRIIITKKYGEPHEFILWYQQYSSSKLLADPGFKWDFHANWYWVDGFGKYQFVNDWDLPAVVSQLPSTGRTLVITSPDNPTSLPAVNQINFLDGRPAFYVKAI